MEKDVFKTILTPIEYDNEKNIFIKREDLYSVAGSNGAKSRSCYYLINNAKENGYNIVVTAGSRKSPQINIVSKIAKKFNMKSVAFCPTGLLGYDLLKAKDNGTEIIQVKAGYNSVIKKRAYDYSISTNNCFYIPFGMECNEAIIQTKLQVKNLPKNINRIVIPIGSGINVAGLLIGLKDENLKIPVIGIRIGADPTKILNKYAPSNWTDMLTIIKSEEDYHTEIIDCKINNITLDPIYESKCVKYLEENDLFWIIGKRDELRLNNEPEYNFFN